MNKKIVVSDDFLPSLSSIDIADLCNTWKKARDKGTEYILHHKFLGLGHLAIADNCKEDASVYFLLADVLEY
jgi:hypothetical protein